MTTIRRTKKEAEILRYRKVKAERRLWEYMNEKGILELPEPTFSTNGMTKESYGYGIL